MQDRFKFRAWWKPKYRKPIMLYDVEKTYDFMRGKPESICADCFGEVLEDEDYIVMQCTGLKDKNGKLIYEWDIIKFTSVYECSLFKNIKEIIFEVVFDNLKYCLNQIKILKGNYSYPYMLDFGEIFEVSDYDYNQTKIKLEVIGNIYENPELIKE